MMQILKFFGLAIILLSQDLLISGEPCDQLRPIKNLPYIIIPAGTKGNKLTVFISGDGGWFRFEQMISDNLANRGIATIGLDSRKYFWTRKSPEESASDIATLIDHFSREWNRDSIIMVGYSFGAEIVPFIVNRLPDYLKRRVTSEVLLSPTANADFEVHLTDMIGLKNSHDQYNVIKEINSLRNIRTLIIFGQSENTKLPSFMTGTKISVVKIPGDHHYKFDTPLIVSKMKENKLF